MHDWAAHHNILIGDRDDIAGDYSELLTRSKFCLVAPGVQPHCLQSFEIESPARAILSAS